MARAKAITFTGSTFQVSSGYEAANPISGAITNANPAVLTDVSHGKTIGVPFAAKLFGLSGMTELNDMHVIMMPLSVDTLQLVGVDSLNYGVHTSGTGSYAAATFVGTCQSTEYSSDTGSTPVDEAETNCDVVTTLGAPRMGTVSLSFLDANDAYIDALEASRKDATEIILRLAKPGYPKVSFDIGAVTQMTSTGSAGGKWAGTANFQRMQHNVKVTTA